MRCEDAVEYLRQQRPSAHAALVADARAHAEQCQACRDELQAIERLRADREAAVPAPDPQLLARSVRVAALRAMRPARSQRRGFWSGAAVGGLLAAGLAIAVFYVRDLETVGPSRGLPEIHLAVNETRNVSIAVDSPRALPHALVRVLLSGTIGVAGFDGQKEISWYTDLEPGVNRLTLPVIALSAGGGQLVVEVEHDNQRRTFVLDVRSV